MIGQTIGPYRILAELGKGGMGEVYRAHDAKLGRDVAIKLLPVHLQTDAAATSRFQREARAVAALNHPNIVTIYGIDEADGQAFIAMELVDGATLRDLLPPGGLPLDDVLKHAIPLADALAAAHAAGIVHRDLKPANVMITKEGRVKVLDFGLAKLREDVTPLAETMTGDLTGKGQVVGTVAYMSPEQASGRELDARSDLFSLGVLLYEMSTGQRPFTGTSSVDVLAAILKDTPASVADLRADLPRDFSRIIRRALAKDPEDRYQTAKDLRNDLKTLRADLTSGALSAVVPVSAPGRSRGRLAAIGVGALVLAGAVGYWAWSSPATTPPAPGTLPGMTIDRLTSTGHASQATVSPDGKYVVHVVSDNQHSLWVRQVATDSNVQIVEPGEGVYRGVAIDPRGDFVYFTRVEAGIRSDLFRVPILGDAVPQLVVRDVDTAVAFSSDGARMAFLRGVNPNWTLVIAAADGINPRTILTTPSVGADALVAIAPAWSADGHQVAVGLGAGSPEGPRLALVDVETGDVQDLSAPAWESISGVAWLGDDALIVSGREPSRLNPQLWYVGRDRTIRRLTNDLNSYSGVAISSAGEVVVTVMGDVSSTLSVTGSGGAGPLTPVTTGRNRADGQSGLTWTHGGQLVFSALNDGRFDLWISDVGNTRAQQLTSDDTIELAPVVSPDDTYLVHGASDRGLTRVNIATRDMEPVTAARFDIVTRIRSDDSLLVSRGDGVYLVDALTGHESLVARGVWGFAASPDGRFVAGMSPRTIAGIRGIQIVAADGGPPGRSFDFARIPPILRWSTHAEALTFLERGGGRDSLWNQPLDGGPPTLLLDLGGDRIYDFAWSDDGRLAIAHGPGETDVVVLRGVR